MERIAKEKQKTKKLFQEALGQKEVQREVQDVIAEGKKALDACMMQIGQMLAVSLMQIEREEIAGGHYRPSQECLYKWGWQLGSIYLGDQKVQIKYPRLRGPQGEVPLESYEKLKDPEVFSDELLVEAMRGMSARKYRETIVELSRNFGVSPSSVSTRLIEATKRKLEELQQRRFEVFETFAIVMDTIHRGGRAFVVAIGIDTMGKKKVLGFWEGSSENKTMVQNLLADIESRGLSIHSDLIFITDGGKALISTLKQRFGCELIHQRCTVHKIRNIEQHLPKKYRKEAKDRFRDAWENYAYDVAHEAMSEFKRWLNNLNPLAAKSLEEAEEELLTLHRLKVPYLLRTSLHSTNMIESMFSTVRFSEKNLKRYSSSAMAQRWLAASVLHAEETFRSLKGCESIPQVVKQIKSEQTYEPAEIAA